MQEVRDRNISAVAQIQHPQACVSQKTDERWGYSFKWRRLASSYTHTANIFAASSSSSPSSSSSSSSSFTPARAIIVKIAVDALAHMVIIKFIHHKEFIIRFLVCVCSCTFVACAPATVCRHVTSL